MGHMEEANKAEESVPDIVGQTQCQCKSHRQMAD